MSPFPILDSHIHLWPKSAATSDGHSWMKVGAHLTRQYSLTDYLEAVPADTRPVGVVYVETDRALPKPPPADSATATDDELLEYVREPLGEFEFLRRIVAGSGDDEGNGTPAAALLKGIVGWAPIQLGRKGLERYLEHAERVAGQETWALVKGFRYLLQGITDEQKFRDLALGQQWLDGLKVLGDRGFTFDVGVDQRSGGIWQLEAATDMIEAVRRNEDESKRLTFVINHLCKPDFIGQLHTQEKQNAFAGWTAAIQRLASLPSVYMKLSGAYSELESQDPSSPWPSSVVVNRIRPWLDVIFTSFGPERIMFGSDWPVCNVGGPGDKETWKSWHTVVTKALGRIGVDDEGRRRIWAGTAIEAYKLEVT